MGSKVLKIIYLSAFVLWYACVRIAVNICNICAGDFACVIEKHNYLYLEEKDGYEWYRCTQCGKVQAFKAGKKVQTMCGAVFSDGFIHTMVKAL